ncbi:MAG: ABC transporter ATP-binding protein [Anaerolineaceae bacterium]|nr:ABC transporter ATP-binding protein [Anaerolineaceae bacterium]
MSLLSIRDLCFRYAEKPVLKNLSLEVEEGEFISLLGPSGCGKTTALMLIAGFEHPDQGVINLAGENINDIPAHRRNMGMVFQNYALFPHMTIIDNVAYGLRQRKINKAAAYQAAEEALNLVQLHGMAHRSPSQLSGGQQQRVALARAIVIKPRLLLLDECLSSLDRKLRVEMEVELRKIQREVGITTLFVTHDQEEALTMSDRVALMREGAVVQFDKPNVIYEHPKDSFVASFLGKANFMEGTLQSAQDAAYILQMDNGSLLEFGASQPLSVGSKYIIAVRPEKISISTDWSKNTPIKGTVSLVTYAGGTTQYGLQALGKDWIIQSQNDTVRGAIFGVGEEMWFGWQSENSLVL